MKQDPLNRLENTAAITAVAGVIISFWQGIAQSRQGEWIILGGICLTVAVFDNLLLIFARNRDPSKAHPMVFPLVILMVVLLIIFPLFTATNAIQYYKATDNVSYAVKKGTGVVRRVYGGDAHVALADSYKDTPVTVIGKQALYARSSMKTVKFPAELKEIQASAFRDCKGLETLELPDTLEKLGKSAFQGCKNLARIVIPPSVTEIPKSAFNGCPKDMVIVGEPGSAAQEYAEKYFTFEASAT